MIAEDSETGKSYWANLFSNETSWVEPEAVTNYNKMKLEAKQNARRITKVSKNDWVALIDNDSGLISLNLF